VSTETPPISLHDMVSWMKMPEAERPSEEVIDTAKKYGADFKLTPDVESTIITAAASGGRVEDLVRQVIQALQENWIFDKILEVVA